MFKMLKAGLALLFVWGLPKFPAAGAPIGILPAPASMTLRDGNFVPGPGTKIYCPANAATNTAQFFQAALKERTGLDLPLAALSSVPLDGIQFELQPDDRDFPEGYSLDISSRAIVVRAASDTGLFYGVQSLLQMVDLRRAEGLHTWQFPAAKIVDRPRYGWRGLMLDESRHFFGKAAVEELLDTMAYLKLNRFHWHLTDEPGWRVEIAGYPNLTRIGGRGDWSDPAAPAAYYTPADIREIVAYASQRHIMIIPEIDMPGHASAATRAYPQFSGGGTNQWAGFTFNPAREETYLFLQNVLREVATMFPGPYIHIGGDEVFYGNQSWSTDPEIVKFAHDHGLTNSMELERYFIRRMTAIVHGLGKTVLGWDEIADAGVKPSQAAVMWWHHERPEDLTRSLTNGFPVIMCPRLPCYFDFVQDAAHQSGRRWKGRFNTLADVYNFPGAEIAGLIPAGRETGVLGIEACVWTEQIQNRERLDFMTHPRLAALAEAGWTSTSMKDEDGFMDRLHWYLRELDRRHILYFNPFTSAQTPEPPGPVKKTGGTANG